MQIRIAQRLKPFSHIPGTYFVLPGATLRFQIFPTLIRIHDLAADKAVKEISLNVHGPVKNFTVMQDLERGCITVWGHTQIGYMFYHITAKGNSFALHIKKQPSEPILDDKTENFQAAPLPKMARLSLGSHTAQDWSRMDTMEEILPIWHRLGQLTPGQRYSPSNDLLAVCQKAIVQKDLNAIVPVFHNLFIAGFDPGLSPRLSDTQHQGFPLSPVVGASSLPLLTEGARLIESLFISQNGQQLAILPALPTEFHFGRMIGISLGDKGILDMEWSKKVIRRMMLIAAADSQMECLFQNGLKRFRLRNSEEDPGVVIPCGGTISVLAGSRYIFDCFEK